MKELVKEPDLEEAEKLVDEYIRRDYTVQIIGLCTVNYQGRAKSKLDRGERLVLSKQDSALLVHGPENYQPKNWQPEVDSYSLEIKGENLVLEARRSNPEETVSIEFESLDMVAVYQMVDRSELKVRGHEVDIHESLEEEPSIVEEGMTVLEREKETPAGFIDVFMKDSEDVWTVIEVKRNPDHNSVLQLQRYIDEIEKQYSGEIRGILVAPKISEKVLKYLEERDLEFVEVEMEDVISSYESMDRGQKGLSDFEPDYET